MTRKARGVTLVAQRVTVHKLNTRGEVTVSYEAEVAERLPGGVRLEARWTRPRLDLEYTTFETGDRFVEWYFADRWYNIFEIHAGDGPTKGWYCNVAEPAVITASEIRCRDLLLDLWVGVDGDTRVLDEDEFAANRDLDDATRAAALAGLAELRELVASRAAPFHALPGAPD